MLLGFFPIVHTFLFSKWLEQVWSRLRYEGRVAIFNIYVHNISEGMLGLGYFFSSFNHGKLSFIHPTVRSYQWNITKSYSSGRDV